MSGVVLSMMQVGLFAPNQDIGLLRKDRSKNMCKTCQRRPFGILEPPLKPTKTGGPRAREPEAPTMLRSAPSPLGPGQGQELDICQASEASVLGGFGRNMTLLQRLPRNRLEACGNHRCPVWWFGSTKQMAIPGLPCGLIHQGYPSISPKRTPIIRHFCV